ncbi:MAG: hypothetical protein AAFZ07_05010 [Actinomycetota bacterium]
MLAMMILFGALVALMVAFGVSAERRNQAPFTELGAQELQQFTRPPGADAPTPYGLRDGRPSKVTNGKLEAVSLPG